MFVARTVLFWIAASFAVGSIIAASAPSEQDLRAAYVLNILRLVQQRTLPAGNQFVLCTVAAGTIEPPLQALQGTLIQARKFVVRPVAHGDLSGCAAVFFGKSAGAEDLLAKAQALRLLTVGNDSGFVPLLGVAAIVLENRRLVVELNRQAVKSEQWAFSSHLLEIARFPSGAGR